MPSILIITGLSLKMNKSFEKNILQYQTIAYYSVASDQFCNRHDCE